MRFFTANNFFDSPNYNYWIEVAALIFLGCLLIRYLASKKFLSKVNMVFGAAIVCGIFDLTLDILGCLALENFKSVSIGLNYFINGSFYFFQICFPCLLYLFLIHLASTSLNARRKLMLFLIPGFLYFLIICINPFTELVFKITYTETEAVFDHGPLFFGLWAVALFYVALTFVTLIALRKQVERPFFGAMMLSLAAISVMMVVQIFHPYYLLTGLAISLACWLNYEHLANASDMEDKVSGVYNYNAFLNYLKDDIRFDKKQYFIVCIVGNITQINSTFGILTGNHVYKEMGNFFKSLNGNKSKKISAYRLSNSRFVLTCKDKATLKIALDAVEEKFNNPWMVGGMFFDISCKGYYVNGDIHATTPSEYMDFISSLEVRIKKSSPDSFISVDQRQIEEISRVKDIEDALRRNIENGYKNFSMYYQPIYQIENDKFNHSEALIRFKDDKLGNIPPSEFIPIAESCGLAHKIDRYVLKTTCEFLRKNPSIDFLDINISGAEFFNNPSKDFIKIVRRFGVDPKKLCLEVTETATVSYPEKLEQFMREMAEEGFSFAIDDFGTGYSNFSRVISKSFNIVKLDKSFLAMDDTMKKILNSVIELLHSLNIPIVIEGVETREQYNQMKELGVQYVQGFYFSRPLPEKDFVKFVSSN